MSDLGARIREAAGLIGGLDKLEAELSGVSRRTLSDYVSEKSEPKASTVIEIAQATGVSIAWLMGEDGRGDSGKNPPAEVTDNVVRLPRFDARASAGRGLVPVNEMPIGEVAFARDFLRNLGANPDYCYILEARGDSMWPTIPDGALLIADASKTEVDDGRIYHFNVMDRALVKRARWSLDGKLYLTSDNMAAGYPPEEFTADRIDELHVGGRIMFTGHAPMPVR
ncbi:helix-turn-helix domain-containing protein [Rhizobium sophoriradicis]|uniref:XRE family transcriptional regulator n=1 Tax=Rhizobium TaxID=379 RepID=UPI0009D538E1|nr:MULTISPECIES: S24 family peptidase [Rhizobium]ARQ59220.1 peptidase S24 family/phage repressor domain-containing protein [Rhizobium sp. Kim5]RSB91802.1 helix-turn-helix domain-containing protein [Rhizobium sophoriradicis]